MNALCNYTSESSLRLCGKKLCEPLCIICALCVKKLSVLSVLNGEK